MQKKPVQKKQFDRKSLKQKIADGYVHARAIIEIVGKPKDYVEDSLRSHMKKLHSEEGIEIIEEKIEKAESTENYFTAFAEVEMLGVDIDRIFSFCYDFMPSSIEIIDPEKMVLSASQVTDMLNDLQARMHSLNTGYIEANETAKFHIKNTAVLLRNFLVFILSARPLSLKQMEQVLGIRPEEIEKVIGILMNEGKVVKDGDFYRAVAKSN